MLHEYYSQSDFKQTNWFVSSLTAQDNEEPQCSYILCKNYVLLFRLMWIFSLIYFCLEGSCTAFNAYFVLEKMKSFLTIRLHWLSDNPIFWFLLLAIVFLLTLLIFLEITCIFSKKEYLILFVFLNLSTFWSWQKSSGLIIQLLCINRSVHWDHSMSTDLLRDLECGFGNTLIKHLHLWIALDGICWL